MQSLVKEYMVDKTRIGFIRFIFEAYEGLAVITTLDSKTGHIQIAMPADRMDEVNMVTDAFEKGFLF